MNRENDEPIALPDDFEETLADLLATEPPEDGWPDDEPDEDEESEDSS